ncbi:MAG: hypothetical protein ACRDJ9_33835 [Dehalococcoidia bacterium]
MPKERIYGRTDHDVIVIWSKAQPGEPNDDGDFGQGSALVALVARSDAAEVMAADLGREGINRLIRSLRTARDQAYRRDE